MQENFDLAFAFKALGEPTRLRIFEFLCARCCPVALDDDGAVRTVEGSTVGQVCCHLSGSEKPTSQVSFHLKELKNAGLILVQRSGRHQLCCVNPRAIEVLNEFFAERRTLCCTPQEAL